MIQTEQMRLLVQNMLKTYTSFRQAMQKKMREHRIDLSYEMVQILVCLWKQEGLKQQELANLTFKDKASLTYLINNLEKRKLVQRIDDLSDKRSNQIYLTVAGKEMQQEVMPLYMEIYEKGAQELEESGFHECINYLMTADVIFRKE